MLRRNPPEVRVKNWQKPSTKIIYIVSWTSVRLFQICSKKNHFLQHQTSKTSAELRTWNTWKYWWNHDTNDETFPVFVQFLPTLIFNFSLSNGKMFSVLFQATIYILSLKKMSERL